MKKHSLAILMAMAGPKSQTSSGSGSSTTSIASPDQSGDAMAPGGGTDDDMEGSEMDSDASGGDSDEYTVPMPKGFKIPSSAESGGYFTTTIEVCKKGDNLMISKIGDVPVSGDQMDDDSQQEDQTDTEDGSEGEDQPSPALQSPSGYAKKKMDENKARNVFQPGR